MTVRPLPADLPHSQVFCAQETGGYMRDQENKTEGIKSYRKPTWPWWGSRSVEFDSLWFFRGNQIKSRIWLPVIFQRELNPTKILQKKPREHNSKATAAVLHKRLINWLGGEQRKKKQKLWKKPQGPWQWGHCWLFCPRLLGWIGASNPCAVRKEPVSICIWIRCACMHINACVCLWIFIHIHVCIYTCMYTFIGIYTYIDIVIYIYLYVYIYLYMYMCIYMYIYIYVYYI